MINRVMTRVRPSLPYIRMFMFTHLSVLMLVSMGAGFVCVGVVWLVCGGSVNRPVTEEYTTVFNVLGQHSFPPLAVLCIRLQ